MPNYIQIIGGQRNRRRTTLPDAVYDTVNKQTPQATPTPSPFSSVGVDLPDGLAFNTGAAWNRGIETMRRNNAESPIGSSYKGSEINPNRQKITTPENFNYSQVATQATPSTVNTAASSTPSYSQASTVDAGTAQLMREKALTDAGNAAGARSSSQLYTGGALTPTPTPTPTPTGSSGGNKMTDPAFLRRTAEQKLTELQKNYLSTLTPSANEQALQSQLTDLQGATQMGISNEAGQGRLKVLDLVRGRQGKLLEQGNLQAQTVAAQLANEQANRTAQGNVYNTMLGYEQDAQTAAATEAQNAQNFQVQMLSAGYQQVDQSTVTDPNSVVQIGGLTFTKPTAQSKLYEVGNSLVDEQGNVVYSAPETSGGEGFTLGENQARYDSEGNLIASNVGSGGYTNAAGYTEVDQKDAQKINQQIAASDAYKAIATAGNLELSIANLESLLAGTAGPGNKFVGKEAGQLAAAYNSLMLQAKEFFNLGVLNGPDEAILKSIVPPPSQLFNFKGGTSAGLTELRNMLSDHLGARYQDIATQYQGYDPSQITNLQTVERAYLENQYNNLLRTGNINQEEYDALVSEIGQSFTNDLSTSQNGSIVNVPLGNKSIQVSSGIANRLAQADAEYYRATGKHIEVSEGVRSHERQAELYQRYRSGQGGRAAPPGQSFHETGNAIDVSGDWKAAEPYLRKYGFLNNLADDKHHFSVGEFS